MKPASACMKDMEVMKIPSTMARTLLVVLLIWLLVASVKGCPQDGKMCKDCIANQMKHICPTCGPVLRCMARCLWGGSSKAKCENKCDCGKAELSDCKRCMSRCKCSCACVA